MDGGSSKTTATPPIRCGLGSAICGESLGDSRRESQDWLPHLPGDRDQRLPLEAGDALENAHAMAAHESPRTARLYDRTGDLDEVERINDLSDSRGPLAQLLSHKARLSLSDMIKDVIMREMGPKGAGLVARRFTAHSPVRNTRRRCKSDRGLRSLTPSSDCSAQVAQCGFDRGSCRASPQRICSARNLTPPLFQSSLAPGVASCAPAR
jgi:hypothetical protein